MPFTRLNTTHDFDESLAIADAFVLTVPAHWWYQTAAGVVYAVAWVSLVMPLAVLGFAMGALAQD